MTAKRDKKEFGDFQTPESLAAECLSLLGKMGIKPGSILEPTCGRGAFLIAAAVAFPEISRIVGVDINRRHLELARSAIVQEGLQDRISLKCEDFFSADWDEILPGLPQPLLIVGNPPWVTSSELGSLQSGNLPVKSNFHKRSGYDAITGKSNFDISEWMILKHLEWLKDRHGIVAMLCKTAVARKVLLRSWKTGYRITSARLHKIDALKEFEASVDACFFIAEISGGNSADCLIYDSLNSAAPSCRIGYHDGIILTDVPLFEKWRHLHGPDSHYMWRSGVKHDCSGIMELEKSGPGFINGDKEEVRIEDTYIYPMLKSSDIGNGKIRPVRKYMIVTQKRVGEETRTLEKRAPKTWAYLKAHESRFARRASSIYRGKPPFSIFGVGDYSFSPWKVAVSGFYKQLHFQVIGPSGGKPVVFDDTVYFLPCRSEAEALFIADLLNYRPAREFYTSMTYWADKRPITTEILKRLNLKALSLELGREKEYLAFTGDGPPGKNVPSGKQLLFI